MAFRDDDPLTPDQIARFAKNGSGCRAWMVRSMAQELERRREWDAPEPFQKVTLAEYKIIEGIRSMMKESG